MKVSIIANVSANGKILLAENPNHHAPKAGEEFYVQKTLQARNLVLGNNTFNVIQQYFGDVKQIFPNTEIVLLSAKTETDNGFKTLNTPQKAIDYLTDKGFEEIIVGGGTQVYNSFLEKDLITDIYFNYIPVITGRGGVLGSNDELFTKFNLTEHKLLTDGIVQVHLKKL